MSLESKANDLDANITKVDQTIKLAKEDGYYIVSVTKLLQYDLWKSIIKKYEDDEVITVCPTEANL